MGVSLCIIARNEAHNIEACIVGIQDVVDEVCVVDTGSTDATADLASALGARVTRFPWCDDFSAARNASLSAATQPWIFWMDADDRVDPENHVRLKTLIAGLGDEDCAYLMQCASLSEAGTALSSIGHVRLFRNDPGVRWERRVHEQIAASIERRGGAILSTDVVIHHHGYMELDTLNRKLARNMRLLELEEREHPLDPQTQFHRGWLLALQSRHAEAIVALNLALGSLPRGLLERKAIGLLARAYWLAGKRLEAVETVGRGRDLYPNDLELLFTEAQTLAARGDLNAAEVNLRRVLAGASNSTEDVIDRSVFSSGGQYLLGVVLTLQGKYADAEQAARAVLGEVPTHMLAWVILADAVAQQGRSDELDALADGASRGARVLLRATALALAGSTQAAQAALDNEIVPPNDPVLGRLAAWISKCGRGESCRILDLMRSDRGAPVAGPRPSFAPAAP